jgi:uncharacterized protein YjgD (DUF1641 family)
MNPLSAFQIEGLVTEIISILKRRANLAEKYSREFAVYVAGYAASLIESPDPGALDRLEAQARAFAETIKEIAEKATAEVISAVVDGIRIFLAVAAAA